MVSLQTFVMFGLTAYPLTLTAERLPPGQVEVVLPHFVDPKERARLARELRLGLEKALRMALVPGVDAPGGARVTITPGSGPAFWGLYGVPRAALAAVALAALSGTSAALPVVLAGISYEDQAVCGIKGVFPALRALPNGARVIVAKENAAEASHAHMAGGPDLEIRAVHNLPQLRALLRGEDVEGTLVRPATWTPALPLAIATDGITEAYRPLVVGTTGPHTLWTTKRRMPSTLLGSMVKALLPPLTEPEAAELTAVYSCSGMLPEREGVIRSHPYRAPHHTTSVDGFTGRVDPIAPGEMSFAHGGVLLLDEVAELPVATLAKIRALLTIGERVFLSKGRVTVFPTRPRLVIATTFACPCRFSSCACTPDEIGRHLARATDFAADVQILTA